MLKLFTYILVFYTTNNIKDLEKLRTIINKDNLGDMYNIHNINNIYYFKHYGASSGDIKISSIINKLNSMVSKYNVSFALEVAGEDCYYKLDDTNLLLPHIYNVKIDNEFEHISVEVNSMDKLIEYISSYTTKYERNIISNNLDHNTYNFTSSSGYNITINKFNMINNSNIYGYK